MFSKRLSGNSLIWLAIFVLNWYARPFLCLRNQHSVGILSCFSVFPEFLFLPLYFTILFLICRFWPIIFLFSNLWTDFMSARIYWWTRTVCIWWSLHFIFLIFVLTFHFKSHLPSFSGMWQSWMQYSLRNILQYVLNLHFSFLFFVPFTYCRVEQHIFI